MIDHATSIDIPVPRHEVFRPLERPESMLAWNPAITSAWTDDRDGVHTGSRFELHHSSALPTIEHVDVIEHERDQRLALHGDLGPYVGALRYRLEDTPEGTRLTQQAHVQPKGPERFVAPLAANRVRASTSESLERLRQYIEAMVHEQAETRTGGSR